MVTSQINRRYVWKTLVLVAIGVMSLCGVSLINSDAFLPTLLVWVAFTFLFSVFFLSSLKRITVVADGFEVQNLLLPFRKRFYRFAEFDYAQSDFSYSGEVLRLIKNGERLVSIASCQFLNFEEVKGAISVKDRRSFSVRDNAEVTSEYNKKRLYGMTAFFILFLLIGVATSLSDLIDGNPVRPGIVVLGVVEVLFFGSLLLIYLFSYKKITVWRGQVEVKRLLWPFESRYYATSDFDGFYDVLQKSNGQLGSSDEESLWLVKDNKLAISVDETMYRNYEDLKNVFHTVRFLGQMEFVGFQSLKYYLGKKLN